MERYVMVKKTITCKDFNGVEYTEECYFNLTETEVSEIELSFEGGLVETINKAVAEQNGLQLVKIFKFLILQSYGKKSEDGRRFIKSEDISCEFAQTAAFNKLFIELATDAQAAENFLKAVLPQANSNVK